MNKLYVSIDGDNAGGQVGTAVLKDDIQALNDISARLRGGLRAAEQWVSSNGGTLISSGGDEMVFMIDPSKEQKLEELKSVYENSAGCTLTIGTGLSLSKSGKALLAGKLRGKNQIFPYDDSVEEIVNQAHDHAQSGEGSAEEQKLDEHYISHLMGDQDDDMQGLEHEQPMDGETSEDPWADAKDARADQDMDGEAQLDAAPEDPQAEDRDLLVDPDSEQDLSDESHAAPADSENDDISDIFNSAMQDPEADADQDPDSSSEQEINLPESPEMKQEASEDSEDPVAQKADEPPMDPSMDPSADPEMPAPDAEPSQFDELESDLASTGDVSGIKQQIAQNLAAFKENKELIDSIKDSNPDLYASILGLLKNLIELAKTLSPAQEPAMDAPEQQVPPSMPPPMPMASGPMGDPSRPKQ